ncbi:XkdQ/YqbQ family protein [Clostridium magnum]|uniref:YqbQ/XkdQ domain-containing protein n=1 Tax=Clostridium magnum DSM 2767 TaxID=1121326 RepID=A0A168E1T9_9CLOT|nr:hypothetical protein [Clostridium magnum]KZL93560.1 hypothetical protein CLMAG_06060 [Clostridium magnum DSM 2767]SHI60449.1 hypothetical protein SAMN02745944_04570 [Clostridium magnum DSM 2767]
MWYLYGLHKDKWVDILPKCNNVTWSFDKDTFVSDLNFDSLYDLPESMHISLFKDSRPVWRGMIIKKNNKKTSASYNCLDYGLYYTKNKMSVIQFNNINTHLAINHLCEYWGLEHDVVAFVSKVDKIYKAKTLIEMVDDMLDMASKELGVEFIREMRNKHLYVNAFEDIPVLTSKYKLGSDFSITRSMENMKNRIIMMTNKDDDYKILDTLEYTNGIKTYGAFTDVIELDEKDESQARNIGQNLLNKNGGTEREATFNVLGLEDAELIRCNRKLPLTIKKYGLDGVFRIKSCSHTLNNNNHKINITITW